MSTQTPLSFPPEIYSQIMAIFDRSEAERKKAAAEWEAKQQKAAEEREAERKKAAAEWEAKQQKAAEEREKAAEEREAERKKAAAEWEAKQEAQRLKYAAEQEAQRLKYAAEQEAQRIKYAAEREAKRLQDEAERKKIDRDWNKRVNFLSDKIGEIVEAMVEGKIVNKFRRFGYEFTQCSRRVKFRNDKIEIRGEIDLFLEDGPVAMLIEVKTSLQVEDVKHHQERMDKYTRYAKVKGDNRTFIAGVAGAVVAEDAREYAHTNGIYVIVQSGDAVKIAKPPEGFKAKEW